MQDRPSTAIITGAGRGIGLTIAETLGRAGARVMLVGRNLSSLRDAQSRLSEKGISSEIFTGDVTSEPAVERLRSEVVTKLGHVDVLVNNAGSAVSLPFTKTDLNALNQMIQSNLTSTHLCMRAFLPGMVERNFGRIINVASIAGKIGFQYTSAYCAAKHAVVGLTRAVALEVAQKGITINAVCPGWVDTPMTDETIRNIVSKTGRTAEEARGFLENQSPLHRLISAEEVAAVVAFLVSPQASGINGQAINVCGGEVFS